MSKIGSLLINVDKKNIIKRSTFWNLVASILNSTMSAVFLFFVTRINGVEKAGMFSIASAFAYQCLSLGNFGMRNFHASDVKYDYKYGDYVYVRIASTIFMYLLLIYFSFCNGYTFEKAIIIFTFGLFKSVDCFEDLLHGEYQRKNRLDVGCILQSFRYFISIFVFIISILTIKNIIISFIIVTIFTLLFFIFTNKLIKDNFIKEKVIFNKKRFKSLFLCCLPICIGNAVNMYVVNCPKYAIDSVMTSKYQTYYGILAMPVFTINLLSMVIYRPYVKALGDTWQDKKYNEFLKLIFKQIFVILGLTFIISLFGYIIGLTLIEFIYGVKIHNYMFAFILLLIGGGLNALAGYFSVVLTAARAQNKLFVGYAMTFLTALLIANPLVLNYGINGAAYLYCLVNIVSIIFFIIFIYLSYIKSRKDEKNG